MSLTTAAIIPARGGSKGIPKKNLMPFCGRPLLFWSIAAAKQSEVVDRVFVSTDDKEIAAVARESGAEVITRPSDISGDTASSESALLHACNVMTTDLRWTPDRILFLQATSPVREVSEIRGALAQFDEEGLDSLLTAATRDHSFWWTKSEDEVNALNYDYRKRPRRQDRTKEDGYYVETGSFYITKREKLIQYQNRLCGKIGVYPVPLWKALEIDSPEDVAFLENVMKFHGIDRALLSGAASVKSETHAPYAPH